MSLAEKGRDSTRKWRIATWDLAMFRLTDSLYWGRSIYRSSCNSIVSVRAQPRAGPDSRGCSYTKRYRPLQYTSLYSLVGYDGL